MENLKYPIGRFTTPEQIDNIQIEEWIKTIESFPNEIKVATENLSDEALSKTYRPQGWTIRQIVHHCADSHMNSLVRFKLALTEEIPTIKPYMENLWAELPDSKNFPLESSLKIIYGVHKRWVHLLKNLTPADFRKQFLHPESNELIDLKTNMGIYAWHCKHHLAHIQNAKKR